MAETEGQSFPVSLRPWSKAEPDTATDLRDKISKINTQRNGFRNVREDDLLAEINNGEDDASEKNSSASEAGSEDEDEKGTMKAIQKKRDEMYRDLFQSREEALFALDAYSLTISHALPTQGKSTMSPELVKTAPVGSLGFEKWENMRKDPQKLESENLMWRGSFMSNLLDSKDVLLAAATRLEKMVASETEYWTQVNSLASNGWSVYKPQGHNAPLEVKFGAAEAGPGFRMKGVAALRPNEDGTIKLDRRLGGEAKTLRLRLTERGEVVSSSVTATMLSLMDLGASLEDKVKRAQSSLFEEELFQEMAMESRIVQPLGVRLRNNVLHLPAGVGREYLVDLVPLDDASELITTGTDGNKGVLDAHSVFLRLLLCHIYHLRLQRRSQPQPPLSDSKRVDPPSAIIRPFLSAIQHYSTCQPLSDFLTKIGRISKSAGLSISCDDIRIPGLHDFLASLPSSPADAVNKSTLHTLLQSLNRPLKTSTTLTVAPSKTNGTELEEITIHLHTNLTPPLSGSEIEVEIPHGFATLLYGPECPDQKLKFADLAELKAFLLHLLSLHISQTVLRPRHPGWEQMDDHAIISKTYAANEKEEKVAVSVKFGEDKIEMRRQRLVQRKAVDLEVWSDQNPTSTHLTEVFDAWALEAKEMS